MREFYRVPFSLDKPVGSRVLPDFESKRSGVVYAPGAIIEVTQEVSMDGVRYLRTDDKKGWVFAYHPKLQITMLEPVSGDYVLENCTYRCICKIGTVPIREGPSMMSKVCEDCIYPEEDIQIVARWVSPDEGSMCFLKLSNNKGWVQLFEASAEKEPFFMRI